MDGGKLSPMMGAIVEGDGFRINGRKSFRGSSAFASRLCRFVIDDKSRFVVFRSFGKANRNFVPKSFKIPSRSASGVFPLFPTRSSAGEKAVGNDAGKPLSLRPSRRKVDRKRVEPDNGAGSIGSACF